MTHWKGIEEIKKLHAVSIFEQRKGGQRSRRNWSTPIQMVENASRGAGGCKMNPKLLYKGYMKLYEEDLGRILYGGRQIFLAGWSRKLAQVPNHQNKGD